MKNYFKNGIILVGISLLLWNCQKDDVYINGNKNIKKNDLKLSRVSYQELANNQKFKNAYFEVKKLKELIKVKNLNNKLSNENLDFIIDTNTINLIEINNFTSYTMRIHRNNTSIDFFENIVIQSDSLENTVAYIIKYIPKNNLKKYQAHNSYTFDGKIKITKLKSAILLNTSARMSQDCTDMFLTSCTGSNNGNCGAPPHIPTGICFSQYSQCIGFNYIGRECYTIGGGTSFESASGDISTDVGSTGSSASDSYFELNYIDIGIDPHRAVLTNMLGINIDSEYSLNSPYNVNMSQVLDSIYLPIKDLESLEAYKKFNCIYEKLTETSTFKNLFLNTFQDSNKFDVKFELVDKLPEDVNGNTQVIGRTFLSTGALNSIDITIKLVKSKINSNSSLDVARIILHESIHAYLDLKKYNCDSGTSLDYLNNSTLGDLINNYYSNFNCSGIQSQHDFMFNYLLPTQKQCLAEIRDVLVPLTHRTSAEQITILDSPLNINEQFNWDKFYYYFSMSGLQNSETFINEIAKVPKENTRCIQYISIGTSFSIDYPCLK